MSPSLSSVIRMIERKSKSAAKAIPHVMRISAKSPIEEGAFLWQACVR